MTLLPKISRWQRDHGDAIGLAVVSRGTRDANLEKAREFGLNHVLLQHDREVAIAYGVPGTPGAVLVRADGTIGGPPAFGPADIARLVEGAVRQPAREPPLTAGISQKVQGAARAAIEETFLDLDGNEVSLSRFRGHPAVLLFWNPDCGFCRRMLEDLKAWEALAPAARARLLVISSGTVEANRLLGLKSTVLLDSDFSLGRQYGAGGTPAAVLLDEVGQPGVAVTGTPDVLAALGEALNAALTADEVPVKHERVEDELLSDGGMILYNATRSRVMTLNGTGALVWEYCDGGHSIRSIAAEIRAVFPSANDAERDVARLIGELLWANMISLSEMPVVSTSAAAFGPTSSGSV